MTITPHVATFLHECEDLLGQVEEGALGLATGDVETIHLVFRAFHTIKGAAAMVGLGEIAAFTHHVESALDQVRTGALAATPELGDVVLAAKDHIAASLAAHTAGSTLPAAAAAAVLAQLASLTPVATTAATAPRGGTTAPTGADAPAARHVITVAPRPGVTLAADAVTAVIAELRAHGAVEVEHADPRWTVRLVTRASADAVRDHFIFLETDAEVGIVSERLFGDASDDVVLFADLEALAAVAAISAPRAPVVSPAVSAASPATAATSATSVAALAPAKPDPTVRVAFSKLDRLVDLVSELVISRSRLAQVAARLRDPDLDGAVEEVERLVVELRDGVLETRMMPIGSTFARFKRLVHDLAGQLAKRVVLVTEGADTELDKHMIDQLGDPLMHLVRNAVDHGVESAEARAQTSKPGTATVRLAATHAGEYVLITITDDGRGLDVDAIRAKGIERGLITAEQQLAPAELFRLIFEPGFSTAKHVSDVSGRGVGMDVVKRQIEALRGTVAISSERGVGTTITLRLPLTLAIIDGLVVEAAGERYIIPLAAVTETVELPDDDRRRHNGRRAVVVRGELVPYLSLRDTFRSPGEPPANEKVVIIQDGDDRLGLVVDRVLGNHQTVIQSLGKLFRGVQVTAGATIMGDGKVALILDLAGIRRLTRRQPSGVLGPPLPSSSGPSSPSRSIPHGPPS